MGTWVQFFKTPEDLFHLAQALHLLTASRAMKMEMKRVLVGLSPNPRSPASSQGWSALLWITQAQLCLAVSASGLCWWTEPQYEEEERALGGRPKRVIWDGFLEEEE